MPRTNRPHKHVKRVRELRDRLWPDLNLNEIWNRNVSDGYTTVPRTMPLIMSIIDDLTKGQPASSAYFELWGRVFDEGIVSLTNTRQHAFHADFSGQRAERTWAERMRKLDKLGFVSIRSGSAGEFSHVLILNPYRVLYRMHEQGQSGLREDKYNALLERMTEIGSTDIEDYKEELAEAAKEEASAA